MKRAHLSAWTLGIEHSLLVHVTGQQGQEDSWACAIQLCNIEPILWFLHCSHRILGAPTGKASATLLTLVPHDLLGDGRGAGLCSVGL